MDENSNILNYFYEKDASLTKREQIAVRLKELRNKTGLTQKQFAERHGFSNASVSSWERLDGRNIIPSLDKLVILADYYDCDIAYLLGETGPSSDVKTISMKLIRDETGLSGSALQMIQREALFSKDELLAHNELVTEDFGYELERYERVKTIPDMVQFLYGCDSGDLYEHFISSPEKVTSLFDSELNALKAEYEDNIYHDWKMYRSYHLRFIDYLICNSQPLFDIVKEYRYLLNGIDRLESRKDYSDIRKIYEETISNSLTSTHIRPDGSITNSETEFYNAMTNYYKEKSISELKSMQPDLSFLPEDDPRRLESEKLTKQAEDIHKNNPGLFNELNFTNTYHLLKNGARDKQVLEYQLSTTFTKLALQFIMENNITEQ